MKRIRLKILDHPVVAIVLLVFVAFVSFRDYIISDTDNDDKDTTTAAEAKTNSKSYSSLWTMVHATTLVAIKYKHGIVIGSDTRTTTSSTSSYVSQPFDWLKMIPITDDVTIATAGDSVMTQRVVRQIQQLQQNQWLQHHRLLSVSQIAHCIRTLVYQHYNSPTTAAVRQNQPIEMLIVGRNHRECQLFIITPSGAILESDTIATTVGSGSIYIVGYLNEKCMIQTQTAGSRDATCYTSSSSSALMEEPEAIHTCRTALKMAIQQDAQSGGAIHIYTMRNKGTSNW
jgi:20S proteasome alpha/beta subunit